MSEGIGADAVNACPDHYRGNNYMSDAQVCSQRRTPVKGLLSAYQRTLTQADVDALCRAGLCAWRHAPRSARRVAFVYRGKRFVVRHTSFRLLINEINGTPVASMWD
jgi:hypothetical protein